MNKTYFRLLMRYIYWLSCLLSLTCTQVLFSQENFSIELISNDPQPALCNDIWGYTDSEQREYAIIGNRTDSRIFSLEDPANPLLIKVIPGAQSIWRDFKSYDSFLYAVSDEGSDGLTIIDMTNAPDSISYTFWRDTLQVRGIHQPLRRCHNLFIDSSGTAYLSGCNIGNGGVIMLDLASDPKDPVLTGIQDERYAHDAIALDTLLYTSEIFEGNLGIYNVSDKGDPKVISRTQTSLSFTHNAWPSDDGRFIFTTDERSNAYIDAYDLRDLTAPQLLDRYRPNSSFPSTPHNVHYSNGYLVTSWYTEGIILVDAHNPDNLVRVGQYDTNLQNADGAWGVYPYLPSGIIIASDLNNGLFILEPTYQRASYVEGLVIDETNLQPINNVRLEILGDPELPTFTNALGRFKMGTASEGSLKLALEHPGYFPDTMEVAVTTGEITQIDIRLKPLISYVLRGKVMDASQNPIANAHILVESSSFSAEAMTNALGEYEFNILEGQYNMCLGAWGFLSENEIITIDRDVNLNLILDPGYQDDFALDLGWTINSTASSGIWERAIPAPTFLDGEPSNPGFDVPYDKGKKCYVTGNNNASAASDDVDNGFTSLVSPLMDLSNYRDPIILFSAWYFNKGGSVPANDTMVVELVTLEETLTVAQFTPADGQQGTWQDSIQIDVRSFSENLDNVKIRFTVADDPSNGHIVEAGIDAFQILEKELSTSLDESEASGITIFPNPVAKQLTLKFNGTTPDLLHIYDMNGRPILKCLVTDSPIELDELHPGIYFIEWTSDAQQKFISKFIKI